MKQIFDNKEYTSERKKRKMNKIKKSDCYETNTTNIYLNPLLISNYKENDFYLFNMDVVYYDSILKDDLFITKEYVTPLLTKRFETVVTHTATPTIENKDVEWNKTEVIDAEIEEEVIKEIGFNKGHMCAQYGENSSVDEKHENKNFNHTFNSIDTSMNRSTLEITSQSTQKKHEKKEKNEKENTNKMYSEQENEKKDENGKRDEEDSEKENEVDNDKKNEMDNDKENEVENEEENGDERENEKEDDVENDVKNEEEPKEEEEEKEKEDVKNRKTNKDSKKIDVFRNNFNNIQHRNEIVKREDVLENEKKKTLLMIHNNMPQEKDFIVYDDNLLNNNCTCKTYTHFCDLFHFFNCNFAENQLNKEKSNDTEVTLYMSSEKIEGCDKETPTLKGSDKVCKKVTGHIDKVKNTGHEIRETKWGIRNGPGQKYNTELLNIKNICPEEHLTEIACSDECNKETRNSNMSTATEGNQTKRSNNSFMHTGMIHDGKSNNSVLGQAITNMKKRIKVAASILTELKVEKRMTSTQNEIQKQRHRQKKKKKKEKEKEQDRGREREREKERERDRKRDRERERDRERKREQKTEACQVFPHTNNENTVQNLFIHDRQQEILEHFTNQVDENIVFIQIENFSQKIEEYINDEKIFRAQKLIEHLKKYTEFYINYFQEKGSKSVAENLLKYYRENYVNNNNVMYNINTLKSNIIIYFLNFFRLNEMVSILNDYCYYFSVDPLISYVVSVTTSENNDNISKGNENTQLANMTEEVVLQSSSPSLSCSNSDIEIQKEKSHLFQFTNDIDVFDLNKNKVVIIDKLYHHNFVNAKINANNKAFFDDPDIEKPIDTDSNRNMSNNRKSRHIGGLIKRYSKRLKKIKKIRRHKRNKEGWVKEHDKFLDLWYQVDSNNNILFHVRAKLPYEINRILCILNETDVSVNWAPFLTSAQKIKHLSKASAIIAQLYEYPVIGKKESIMYCLGANVLEELGCIILCCKAPPDFAKDILFYENMCENLQINKKGEIIKIKDIPTNTKKTLKQITFFDFLMPQPTSKIDRQRAADLFFLLYPLDDGKATILELFVYFEVDFKYTPIKMVTYFIKKIVRNMYENIVKCCKNYENKYSQFLNKNKEFYDWLDKQIQGFLKNKNDIKHFDTISLRSYEPETND